MPIDVNLGQQPTTTINQSNVEDGNIDLTLGANGTLIVDGVNASIVNIAGAGIISNTTFEAIDGATVSIGNNVASVAAGSTFTYDIGAGSTIEQNVGTLNVGLLNGSTVNFENTGGTGTFVLVPSAINLNLSNIPVINGLSNGDKIEVIGATSASLSGDVLTFTYPGLLGLNTTTSFLLNGIPGGSSISFDASTGTVVFACFLRGTLVWTPKGEVSVESLRVGDEVLSLKCGRAPIKWIGRRVLEPRMISNLADALPVRVRKDAIAENVPRRDLLLSPDHCLFFEQSLIPVKFLINGKTIVQENWTESIEYFHIELDRHDVIAVEGVLAETYIDLGNRSMFGGPGVAQVVPKAQYQWADYAYPPVYEGELLRRVYGAIYRRADLATRSFARPGVVENVHRNRGAPPAVAGAQRL